MQSVLVWMREDDVDVDVDDVDVDVEDGYCRKDGGLVQERV